MPWSRAPNETDRPTFLPGVSLEDLGASHDERFDLIEAYVLRL